MDGKKQRPALHKRFLWTSMIHPSCNFCLVRVCQPISAWFVADSWVSHLHFLTSFKSIRKIFVILYNLTYASLRENFILSFWFRRLRCALTILMLRYVGHRCCRWLQSIRIHGTRVCMRNNVGSIENKLIDQLELPTFLWTLWSQL